MNIIIKINDSIYKQLKSSNGCVKGSIRLCNATEGSFTAYLPKKTVKNRTYMRLPHGRVSIGEKNVTLSMRLSLDEQVNLPQAIIDEGIEASTFVELYTDDRL